MNLDPSALRAPGPHEDLVDGQLYQRPGQVVRLAPTGEPVLGRRRNRGTGGLGQACLPLPNPLLQPRPLGGKFLRQRGKIPLGKQALCLVPIQVRMACEASAARFRAVSSSSLTARLRFWGEADLPTPAAAGHGPGSPPTSGAAPPKPPVPAKPPEETHRGKPPGIHSAWHIAGSAVHGSCWNAAPHHSRRTGLSGKTGQWSPRQRVWPAGPAEPVPGPTRGGQ